MQVPVTVLVRAMGEFHSVAIGKAKALKATKAVALTSFLNLPNLVSLAS